ELGGALRALEPLERPVLQQLDGSVGVDEGALCPRGCREEVAVPGRELLEGGQQILAFRAPRRPANALLGLACRQIEAFDGRFLALLRLGRAGPRRLEEPLGSRTGIEARLRVDRACRLQQLLAPLRRGGVEQALGAVEPPARDTRDRGGLVLRELRRPCLHLLPHGPLREPPERNRLAARAD